MILLVYCIWTLFFSPDEADGGWWAWVGRHAFETMVMAVAMMIVMEGGGQGLEAVGRKNEKGQAFRHLLLPPSSIFFFLPCNL